MEVMTQFSYLKPLHGVQLVEKPTPIPSNGAVRFTLPFTQVDQLTPFNSSAIWQLHDKGERYTTDISLFQQNHAYQLAINCEGTGRFAFDQQHMQVCWQPGGTGYEHYIQSTAIACWLELQGVPCIHANAMCHDNDAFLFIAPSRTGKSTLTTHLMQHGYQMMTDDMAALHQVQQGCYQIYPSWPKIRLWPDSAQSLIGTKVDVTPQQVNPDSANNSAVNKVTVLAQKNVHAKFAKQELELDTQQGTVWRQTSAPLKAIYVLARSDNNAQQCQIEQINASKAVILLLQNSMLANAYTNLGLELQRLQWFAALLSTVNVYKISYKSGVQYLPQVCEHIKCHSKSLS